MPDDGDWWTLRDLSMAAGKTDPTSQRVLRLVLGAGYTGRRRGIPRPLGELFARAMKGEALTTPTARLLAENPWVVLAAADALAELALMRIAECGQQEDQAAGSMGRAA